MQVRKNKTYVFDTLEVIKCDLQKVLKTSFKGQYLADQENTLQNEKKLKEANMEGN